MQASQVTPPPSVPHPVSAGIAAAGGAGSAPSDRAPVDRSLLVQGIELQNKGQVDQARAVFELYLTHFPDDGIALYSQAVILMSQHGPERALPLVVKSKLFSGVPEMILPFLPLTVDCGVYLPESMAATAVTTGKVDPGGYTSAIDRFSSGWSGSCVSSA